MATSNTKKIITFSVNIDDDFDGHLSAFAEKVVCKVKSYVFHNKWQMVWQGVDSIKLDTNSYGYNNERDLIAVSERFETDEEFNDRLRVEANQKQAKKEAAKNNKENELKTLEKLAKKHGKKLV